MKKTYITAIKKDVNNPSPAGETPAVGVDVYVYLKSTGAQAIIYSDNGVTQKTQPLVTDSNGRVEFYAANGRYNIEYNLPSGIQTDEDIIIYDESDNIASTLEAKEGTNDSKFMTPLKTHQSFNQFGIGAVSQLLGGTSLLDLTLKNGFYYAHLASDAPSTAIANYYLSVCATTNPNFRCIFATGVNAVAGSPRIYVNIYQGGVWSGYSEIINNLSFDYFQNVSGVTVPINSTVPGSGLVPARPGTWLNVSGNDVINNSYGLFRLV